jgi:integrase
VALTAGARGWGTQAQATGRAGRRRAAEAPTPVGEQLEEPDRDVAAWSDGRRRYKSALKKAKLRPLRFHDLRHTFGTRMIAKADIRRVQEWMGHADIQTTMRYLHYAPREEDARLVAEAFEVKAPNPPAASRERA